MLDDEPPVSPDARRLDDGQALVDEALQSGVGVGVELITSAERLRAVVEDQARVVQREVWNVLPAGPYSIASLRQNWDRDVSLHGAGIRTRHVYQADAARSPGMLRYLTEFAASGAEVRVARRVTHRLVIADRRVALVASRADTMGLPYLFLSEPALVTSFADQFEALWRSAQSVGVGPEDTLSDAGVREIVQMLMSGATDEVAARQLGVSDRTIRRRVSAVMTLLGATSRFEAGVRAVQAGWV